MSAYFAVIANNVEGPFEIEALQSMNLEPDTAISPADGKNQWMMWREIMPSHVPVKVHRASVIAPEVAPTTTDNISETLRNLRYATAYPVLRKCLTALLGIAGIALVVFGLSTIFDEKNRMDGFIGVICALGSMLSTVIIGVLVDIADAQLRKLG